MKQNLRQTVKNGRAFTLVELLVVMSIIGILASLAVGNFRSVQARGRDAQRKSDLKQIAHSLELFYGDYGRYPAASGSTIAACSYNPVTSTGSSCAWGTGSFTDSKTVYFKTIPKDPIPQQNYFYRIVPASNNQKYQIFAYLESVNDPDKISGLPNYSCGTGKNCNFAVTSANAGPTE